MEPCLSPPLSRSKNDCVGHEGFMSAVSQSECRGKSRLTFLASGKKKQLHFMSTFCSANQGAEETVCLGKLFHFLLLRLGLVFPAEARSKSIKALGLESRRKEKPLPVRVDLKREVGEMCCRLRKGIWGGAGRGRRLSSLRSKEIDGHLCKEFLLFIGLQKDL